MTTKIDFLLHDSRRTFLTRSGALTLSATAVGLLAGCQTMASHDGTDHAQADVAILNVALGLEHEAVGAYQLGAESGLLTAPVLDTALLFQGHHKAHAAVLGRAVTDLGGVPVQSRPLSEYAAALHADALRDEADVLALAARLEQGAANAYVGVLPSFEDPALAQTAARLAADETMHWALLASALGRPVPRAALSIGA